MSRVTVYIISTDGRMLKGQNTTYIREPPHMATVRSTKVDKHDAMSEFYEAIQNEEEALGTGVSSIYGSVSRSTTPGYKWSAILRKVNTANPMFRPLTGVIEAGETPIQAAVREFGEELGSTIAPGFFIQSPTDPNTFIVNVAADAKDTILSNHSDLDPFTELVNVNWARNTDNISVPAGSPTVTVRDISKHPDADASKNIHATFRKLKQVSKSVAESVLDGGKTIRRKKLKRSKRKGTSKRGGRR